MLAIFFSAAAAQNQNDLKRCHEFYEKALQEKKTTARLELLQKAAQLCEAGDLSALSPAARRQFAAIHFALGREYFQQTKWPAAIAHLEKAVAGDPTFFAAHATLGLIYFQQRKYGEAIAAYNKVLPAQPSAQLYNNLGAAHEAKGELEAAIAAYRRALELDAKLAPAQKNLQRAQEKLALSKPASAIETKLAAIDSAQRADSLAAVAKKSAPSLTKNKTLKGQKPERAKTPEIKTAVLTTKNKNASVAKKGKPVREIETAISSPARSLVLKKDSAATRQFAGFDSTRKKPASVLSTRLLPQPDAVSVPANSSGNSALAYICGAGVVLFGVLIFTQRRRLNRVWLQFKPVLATPAAVVMTEERLVPAAAGPRVVAIRNERLLAAPVVQEPAVAAGEETFLPTDDDDTESRQPSLQTQAFFAEMIAAEPEIGDFENDSAEELQATLKPTNGHLSVINDQLSVISYKQQEASDQLPVISYKGQETSTQLPTTSFKQQEIDNPLPAISDQSPATDYKQQETNNQSKRSENPAAAGLPSLGRYQIEREIGKGAMGKIYLARDPKLDRRVVIKTVSFKLAAYDADATTLKDRIYREARAIAKLSHPNIVVVYDVEDDHELSYIVMEHIEGRDLRQALKGERRFDYERAVKIIAQVCSALDYAHHAGIIHRDIKPSNIMLLPNDKVKVTDFGIAKIADNFSLTLTGHVLGTPSYMAPEQFEGENSDSRADTFSAGVVFYELLTGTRPFTGDSLAALAYKIVHKVHIPPSLQNVELPLELDEIIARALAKNPEERYQSALEFRDALLAAKFQMAA